MTQRASCRPLTATTLVNVTMVKEVSAGMTGILNMPIQFTIQNGDQCALTFRQNYQGSILENVLHFQAHIVGADITTGREELINLITEGAISAGSIGQLIRAVQSEDLVWFEVSAQMVFPTRYPYILNTINILGEQALPGVPSNVDAVLVKRSSTVGRGRSGTLHIGGFPLDDLDGALITETLRTAVAAIGTEMANDINMVSSGAFWRPIVGVKKTMADPESVLAATVAKKEVRVMVKRTAFRGI